jgi:hypothetical protein
MPPSISDPAGTPEPVSARRFLWPSEYYATETPKAVLAPWATYGCGIGAVVVLIAVFAGGAWLAGGGFLQVLDLSFGMTLGEMRGMYTPEVTPAQKQVLEETIDSLREHVRNGRVPVKNLQGLLQTMQKAMKDDKLSGAEVDSISRLANESLKVSKPQSHKGPAAHVGTSQGQ